MKLPLKITAYALALPLSATGIATLFHNYARHKGGNAQDRDIPKLIDRRAETRVYHMPNKWWLEIYDEPFAKGRHCVAWGATSCQPDGVKAASSSIDVIRVSDDDYYFIDPENTAYVCAYHKPDLTCTPKP